MRPKTKYLGKQNNRPTKNLDLIPWSGPSVEVTLDCTEFTSHCPVTGAPDFAHLVIKYTPDRSLVETKSIKLYLWSFRGEAEFNEKLIQKIAQDFFLKVSPKKLLVYGKFNPRGGISVNAQCELPEENKRLWSVGVSQ